MYATTIVTSILVCNTADLFLQMILSSYGGSTKTNLNTQRVPQFHFITQTPEIRIRKIRALLNKLNPFV